MITRLRVSQRSLSFMWRREISILSQTHSRQQQDEIAIAVSEMETMARNAIEPNKLSWKKLIGRITTEFASGDFHIHADFCLRILKTLSRNPIQGREKLIAGCIAELSITSRVMSDETKWSTLTGVIDSDFAAHGLKDLNESGYGLVSDLSINLEISGIPITDLTYYLGRMLKASAKLENRALADRLTDTVRGIAMTPAFESACEEAAANRNFQGKSKFIWGMGVLVDSGLRKDWDSSIVRRCVGPEDIALQSTFHDLLMFHSGLTRLGFQGTRLMEDIERALRIGHKQSSHEAIEALWFWLAADEKYCSLLDSAISTCANKTDWLKRGERLKLSTSIQGFEEQIKRFASAKTIRLLETNILKQPHRRTVSWLDNRAGVLQSPSNR